MFTMNFSSLRCECDCVTYSVVPERVHILGEREPNVRISAWWTLLWTHSFCRLWTPLSHCLTSFKRVPDFHETFQVKTRLKHRKQALIPNLATQATTESHHRMRHQIVKHGCKNKWRQQHYFRLCFHHKYSLFLWLLKTIIWKGQ